MFKVESSIIPKAFNQVFSLIYHICPKRSSDNRFNICDFNLKSTHFAFAFRGPTIQNKFFRESEKPYTTISIFKSKIKKNSNFFLFF